MRYAIISDVHANLEALQAVLATIDALGAQDGQTPLQVVCLGDVVGYNANPDECVNILRERGIPTICGNHDAVACGIEEPWGFNPIALSAALWTRDHLSEDNRIWLRSLPDSRVFEHFVAAHGAPNDRDTYLFTWEDVLPHFPFVAEQALNLCFFGHTHCPGIFSADGAYSIEPDSPFTLMDDRIFFINPGSVGQPRDGDPRAAFGIYDSDRKEYRQMRVEYPVEQTAERIRGSGLPEFLAERIFLGR